MNRPNYCPVKSSTQMAAWLVSSLPSLPVCLHNLQISKAWGRSASLWRPSIQVVGHQDMKQGSRVFIGQRILLVTPLFLLQAGFSNRHFTSCRPQISLAKKQFESAFCPQQAGNQQISALPLPCANKFIFSLKCEIRYEIIYAPVMHFYSESNETHYIN